MPEIKQSRNEIGAALQNSVEAAFHQYGPCEIRLSQGTLRITDQGGQILGVEGLSAKGTQKFGMLLDDGNVSFTNETSKAYVARKYPDKDAFLKAVSSSIAMAVLTDRVTSLTASTDMDLSKSSLPPRSPERGTLSSLEKQIQKAWSTVDALLQNEDGTPQSQTHYELFDSDGRYSENLRIWRITQGEPSIMMEINLVDDKRDILMDNHLKVTSESIAYYPANSSEPAGDTQLALQLFHQWLSRVEEV